MNNLPRVAPESEAAASVDRKSRALTTMPPSLEGQKGTL